MNTEPRATTPIAGLLSLMADLVDHSPDEGTRTSGEAPALERRDLVAALEHVARGWLSVREDGHGWLLVQFAPRARAGDRQPSGDDPSRGSARPSRRSPR